jgi:hypothetical protein
MYKVYNGSEWVDICDCNLNVYGHNNQWVNVDPRACEVRFWNGTEWCLVNCEGTVIDDKTEINIWFDNSGSMNTTLAPLQEMRDTLLEACLLPYYNNDVALYNERVKVLNMENGPSWSFNERFVKLLGIPRNFNRTPDTTITQVINLTFQDESDVYGYGGAQLFDNSTRTPVYDSDIADTRLSLTSEPYVIKGCAFRVNTGPNSFPGFRGLTEATFVDTGVYTPPFNLSDYTNTTFTYELDVIGGSTAVYYKDLVIAQLQALGISVPDCP